MARVEPEDWEGREVTRVYIAGRRAEARAVEATLDAHGIDYMIDLERFRLMVLGLFPSEHTGVGFYVLSGEATASRQALVGAGLKAGLEEDVPE
jgi:hypothetical protein